MLMCLCSGNSPIITSFSQYVLKGPHMHKVVECTGYLDGLKQKVHCNLQYGHLNNYPPQPRKLLLSTPRSSILALI